MRGAAMVEGRFALALVITAAACQGSEDRDAAVADQGLAKARVLAAEGLQMSARPLREVVPTEGPLSVEVTVRNGSDSVVRFRPIFTVGGWLRADIIGPSGSTVPLQASVDPPNAWAVSLRPMTSVTDTVDLRCDVPEPTRSGCVAPYDLSNAGEYHIKLRFSLPCEIKPCGEPVVTEAETFTIRVGEAG